MNSNQIMLMKKMFIIGLLALMSVGGISCAYAQTNEEAASVSASGASTNIAALCSALDQALDQLKTNPSDLSLSDMGAAIEKKTNELDHTQKLTPADKALLKKTMHKLMETVVSIQMMENPQMAQMLGNLTEDQKKEMIDQAMNMISKEIDGKIDKCDTIGDFANIQM